MSLDGQLPPGVTERPILFSGPMVQAILEGRKTQSRKRIQSHRIHPHGAFWNHGAYEPVEIRDGIWSFRAKDDPSLCTAAGGAPVFKCPYGTAGSRLWVRETFFMPRRLSRITLRVVEVRVQRLQDITEADAKAEGAEAGRYVKDKENGCFQIYVKENGCFHELNDEDEFDRTPYRDGLSHLWDSLPGFGWDSNPYVWAITFKRIRK